jgi:hypothetical protein
LAFTCGIIRVDQKRKSRNGMVLLIKDAIRVQRVAVGVFKYLEVLLSED